MSITPLKKITLFGGLKDKYELLDGLQALGCVHLLPLRPPPSEVEKTASPRADGAYKALDFLTVVPGRRRQVVKDLTFDVDGFVTKVLELKQQLRDAGDRREFLQHRIGEVEPWGDIEFPPHEALVGYRLWFYRLPIKHLPSLEHIEHPWSIVRKDHRFAFAVLIAAEEPPGDILPVARTHVGALPLRVLREQLEETEILIEELRAQRHGLTKFVYLLSLNLAEAENNASLAHAEQQTLDDAPLVAVQGWAPEEAVEQIETFAKQNELALLVEPPSLEDNPPTLIDQPDDLSAGTDLTMFYQVPSYGSWDPTILLVGSFCLFFAMIMADAGYGLLLLTGLLLYWRRLNATTTTRAYRHLGLALSGCAIAYGVLVGSYFGAQPPEGTVLSSLNILSVNDFDTMMRISIIIGVLHVGFANVMRAYANWAKRSAKASLGWILALAGGLFVWLSGMTGPLTTTGYGLVAAGAFMILFFSSDRPITKPSDNAWRFIDGVQALAGAMGAFGDVLSYMRLFALGLASASLAVTFNDLASTAYKALPGLGVLAAGLILLLGHALNLGLGVMSGVVHGLRLNFIEFYKWGLPEEGNAFRTFSRREVQP